MKPRLLLLAVSALAWAFSINTYALDDVTAQYIADPGFENIEAYTGALSGGDNVNNSIDYLENGWENTSWASWSCSAVVQVGGAGTVAGVGAPSDGTGNMFGFSVGWNGIVT